MPGFWMVHQLVIENIFIGHVVLTLVYLAKHKIVHKFGVFIILARMHPVECQGRG